MKYGALAWMSGAATHTRRLDTVQRRALRLLEEEAEIPASMTSLEHRRDVSALTVTRLGYCAVLNSPSCACRYTQPTGRHDKHKQVITVLLCLSPTVRSINEHIKPG